MKYFSEKTRKTYDTPQACEKAEAEYDAEQKRIQDNLNKAMAEKKAADEQLAKSKKELSKAIETAESELSEANKLYEVAETKAADILSNARKEANQILDAARVKVKSAQQKKYDALMAFNKKFGTYTTTITGEKAIDMYNKAMKEINSNLLSVFDNFFRF